MTEVNKVLGLGEIKAILPYRYPVLMLDRVQNLGGGAYVAVKNVSMNELFFRDIFRTIRLCREFFRLKR